MMPIISPEIARLIEESLAKQLQEEIDWNILKDFKPHCVCIEFFKDKEEISSWCASCLPPNTYYISPYDSINEILIFNSEVVTLFRLRWA